MRANSSGSVPSARVVASMMRMPLSSMNSISVALSMGAMSWENASPTCTSPLARPRCCGGTAVETSTLKAGCWNALAADTTAVVM